MILVTANLAQNEIQIYEIFENSAILGMKKVAFLRLESILKNGLIQDLGKDINVLYSDFQGTHFNPLFYCKSIPKLSQKMPPFKDIPATSIWDIMRLNYRNSFFSHCVRLTVNWKLFGFSKTKKCIKRVTRIYSEFCDLISGALDLFFE